MKTNEPEMRHQMVGEPDAAYEWYAQTHTNWINERRESNALRERLGDAQESVRMEVIENEKLRERLANAQDSFNSALKALDRNDERRGREYAKFLTSGAGDGEASTIAIRRIFEIVNSAYSGRLCNYSHAKTGNGDLVPISDVIIDAQEQAEKELFERAGVDVNA